ncbi:4Fe-4S binding protein [Desulfotignum phosphitoxidans]|uniref:NAD-dependent formate dehydrogenase subunit beta n=1 Tax=Desulfotignum phosphitoxidans DSM 13687 TaxID=1286635 RepID=S0G7Q9_9BACT|nr:4Fe-4S binding protein [Desulfotignum phosphitoxidans]EMS81382.1 NAD-dependent formate dehydrogenase subunit beta [Desulfotignum phosphitoxidans DSM 13687]
MDMVKAAKELLLQDRVDIFLGYRKLDGHQIPHGFTKAHVDDLDQLEISLNRYPLEKIACDLAQKDPTLKIGILARDCSQRALNLLYTWDQLNPENIETLTVNCCPSSLSTHGDCSYLKPKTTGEYKKAHGIDYNDSPKDFMAEHDSQDRLSRWMYEFQKCIKCYGCRNICPVCFCKECSLEHPNLVEPGVLPPEVPIFHLIRATHMAGRCIDCGLCEDACPAHIPLRMLYREVNDAVFDIFGYVPGDHIEKSPFSIIGKTVELTPAPMDV